MIGGLVGGLMGGGGGGGLLGGLLGGGKGGLLGSLFGGGGGGGGLLGGIFGMVSKIAQSPIGKMIGMVFPPAGMAMGAVNMLGMLGNTAQGVGGGQNY